MSRGPERFQPARSLADAALLFIHPRQVFEAAAHPAPISTGVVQIFVWGLLTAAVDVVFIMSGLRAGPDALEPNLAVLAIGGPFYVLFAAFLAAIYHGLAKAAGGAGDYKASFRVLAAVAPFAALDALIGRVPFIRLPLILYKFYLAYLSVRVVHKAPRKRSLYVFGPVCALLLLLNIRYWLSG